MKNSWMKRALAVLLCLAVFAVSELSGVTNVVRDLYAEEMDDGSETSEDADSHDKADDDGGPAEAVEEVALELSAEDAPQSDEQPQGEPGAETTEGETTTDGEAGTEPGGEAVNPEDGTQAVEGETAEGENKEDGTPAESGAETEAGTEGTEMPAGTEEPASEQEEISEGQLAEGKDGGSEVTAAAVKPEEKPEPVLKLVNDEDDNITVTAEAKEAGIIPAGASLSVTPIEKKEVTDDMEAEEKAKTEEINAQYDLTAEKLAKAGEEREDDIVGFLAYNICFTDEEGNKLAPDGEVEMKLEYKEAVIPEEVKEVEVKNAAVTVMQLEEDADGELEKAVDLSDKEKVEEIQTTDSQEVETTTFVTDSSNIYALAWTGEIDPLTGEFTYENDDVIITVSEAKEGAIPEGSRLSVIPIVPEHETAAQYQEVADQLQAKAENETYEIAGFLAYDIKLIDKDGNKTEPNGDVKVTMNYKKAAIPADMDTTAAAADGDKGFAEEEKTFGVTVMHLEENGQGGIDVVDMAEKDKVEALDVTSEKEVQKAEFVTDSFSVFTIAWTWDDKDPYVYEDDQVKITITPVDENSIPEGTTLSITPIKADDEETAEQYQEVARKLLEKAEGEEYDITGFLAYDISLIDGDSAEIEPAGKVKVTMEYKRPMAAVEIDADTYALIKEELAEETEDNAEESIPSNEETSTEENAADDNEDMIPAITASEVDDVQPEAEPEKDLEVQPEEEVSVNNEDGTEASTIVIPLGSDDQEEVASTPSVTVMHLEEDKDGEVAQVVDMRMAEKIESLDVSNNMEVQKIEFETESFSVFTVIWQTDNNNTKRLEIEFRDINNNVLNPPNDIANSLTATLSKYNEVFDINQIKEGGTYHDLYKFEIDGKTYQFVRAANIWKDGYDITKGTTIDGLMLSRSGNGTQWNPYSYKVEFRKKGETGWSTGQDSTWYDADKFYFIYLVIPPEKVKTVDNVQNNIIMRMVNHTAYGGGNAAAGAAGNGAYGLLSTDREGKNALGKATGSDTREVSTGLVNSTLTDGYPVLAQGAYTGNSLSELFAGGSTVNYLFREDILTNTGYFEYDSAQNYAYLTGQEGDEERTFEVYDAIGTPINSAGTSGWGAGYWKGNFFPYNPISDGYYSAMNDNGKNLNLVVGDPDYYFGMYMEASFAQPENGKVVRKDEDGNVISSDDMVYNFTGDDDLWIFIDDKLILDMGGVHSRAVGSINFASGDIVVNGTKVGTIRSMYENACNSAGIAFPSEIFDGDTFREYTTHTLKMFYLERGAGASSLHMSMNLQTIPSDSVLVTKQLKDSNPNYANVDFPFQLFAAPQDPNNEGQYLENAKYVLISSNATKMVKGEDGAMVEVPVEFGSDGVFYLKPGQTATFKDIPKNRKYYVKELDVEKDKYSDIIVNGISYEGHKNDENQTTFETGATTETEGKLTLTTSKQTVAQRGSVTFTNDCSDANSKPLYVKKVMSNEEVDEGPFDIKIWMEESISGKLQPYTGKYYLIKYVEEVKHYYQYVTNDGSTESVLSYMGTEMPALENCSAAVNGIIKIPSGYMIETEPVIAGTHFAVEELNLNPELYDTPTIEMQEGDSSDGSANVEGITALGRTKLGEGATVEVTNTPIVQYTWKILKKSTSSDDVSVVGAKFTLTGSQVTYTGESQTDGSITWKKEDGTEIAYDDIPKGTYTLQETSAPTPYIASDEIWTIVLEKSSISVTKDGVEVSTSNNPEEENKLYTYTFYNTPAYALPSTGGSGTYWYTIGGTLLMIAGMLILYRNKKRYAGRC